MILYGKPVADALREQYAERIDAMAWERTLTVKIDGTEDQTYLSAIIKEARKWKVKLAYANCMEYTVTAEHAIDICKDPVNVGLPSVDGQSVFGRHETYRGNLCSDTPCTAEAIIRMLDYYDIPIAGRHAVVIGRSERVGKPTAMLLLARDATVTVCHSHTPRTELNAAISRAWIIVCASGQKRLLDYWTQVKCLDSRRAVIINVGGDYEEKSAWAETMNVNLCPFRGGVGPVTTAVLMSHVLM